MNEDDDNETAPEVIPGEDLTGKSSNDSLSADSEND